MASQFRRDVPAAHEHAEAAIALAIEHGIPLWAAYGASLRGWALALQGQGEEGLAQIRSSDLAGALRVRRQDAPDGAHVKQDWHRIGKPLTPYGLHFAHA
jgi:hypothetical protein